MTTSNQALTRRQVLRGTGGISLAIPFLPSLLPRNAQADIGNIKRLWWITTGHGGAFDHNMFPAQSTLANSMDLFPDHQVRSGKLMAVTDGSNNKLSAILKANAGTFTPKLVEKMNVLYGLDVPFYISHNTGLHLGNYARNDGNDPMSGGVVQKFPRPTIDQILAWSPKFYTSLNGISERSMLMGRQQGGGYSWNYSNPQNQSGTIQDISAVDSSQYLFSHVFAGATSPQQVAKRPPIVDRVMQNWKNLRESNRRLSAVDRVRLDDYVAHLAELQRKLTLQVTLSCGDPTKPSDESSKHGGNNPADFAKALQLYNDVVVAAFACGASRIGVMGVGDTAAAVGYGGDWHQKVAHDWQSPLAQSLLVGSYQFMFENVFVDLAAKLNALTDSDGRTVLDNTLMAWSQECCMSTHDSCSIPVVTAGSAGGWFKTGQFVDYRRITSAKSLFGTYKDPSTGQDDKAYLGLLYSQWLGNVLQSMGLAPSDYERWGSKGYGYAFVGPNYNYINQYVSTSSRYFTMAGDPLPFMKA